MTARAAATVPSPGDEPPYAWVVVWACFGSLAVIFGVAYSFAAFFESFAREFDAQRADVSMVFGLCGLIYFVMGVGGGMLADRFGPRVTCVSGMVLIATGLLGTSLSGSMPMVYAAYGVCIGLGIALVYTPAIGCVQPWFTRRRGLASGIASAGIGAGTLVVPLLASGLITALPWRDAMRIMALGVLVLGVGSAWLMRRAPTATTAPGALGAPPPGMTLRQTLRQRTFWWLYAATVLAAPVMFVPFAHVSAAARDAGIDNSAAVGLVGLIGIGSLVGRFAIGALADRPSQLFASRFGEEMTHRLRRLQGHAPAPLTPRRPIPMLWLERRFAEPIGRSEHVEAALSELAQEACARLGERREGGRLFEACFFRADGG
jgi:MFS family permease